MTKIVKILFLCYLALLIEVNLFAKVIKGVVVNEESGKLLDSVKILVMHKNQIIKSYITDSTGNFFIEIPDSLKNKTLKILFFKDGFVRNTRSIIIDSSVVILEQLYPKSFFTHPITVFSENYTNQLYRNITTIEGKDLMEKISSTFGMILQNEVDFFTNSMGPITSKPSFRGLSQNYLGIFHNKLPIKDFSITAPDHAIAIDPISFTKFEIIRGPRILLFSNTSFGTIINLSKRDYLIEPITKPSCEIVYLYESAYQSNNLSIKGELPISNFFVSTDIELKKGEDVRSAQMIVQNSYFDSFAGSFMTGVKNSFISASAFLSGFKLNYGVPGGFVGAHPKGADIKLDRQNQALQGLIHFHSFIDYLELNISRIYYYHVEYEKSGAIGAEFYLNNIFTDIKFNIPNKQEINDIVIGVSGDFTNQKYGGYVFAPNTFHYTLSIYNYFTINFGKNLLEFASRFSHSFFKPEANPTLRKILPINRSFNTISSSINFIHNFNESLFLSFLISRSERNPTIEELYSNGPHLASFSYEVGNKLLKPELGYGIEFSTKLKINIIDISSSIFNYEFANYIYPVNTGDTNYSQLLPIYQVNSTKARKFGFNLKVQFEPIEDLNFAAFLSLTKGICLTTKKYLPMMPPVKGGLQLKFLFLKRSELSIETMFSLKQTLLGENETVTPGYIIFNLMMNRNFEFLNMHWGINIKLENITNRTFWNHLSRIKSIYPEPGRNLKLSLNIFN